jgi:Carboxypeptidase regulatory-like domain
MLKNMLRLIGAGLISLALALATKTTFGQGVTTSGINGFVTDKQGKPVAGATVTVTAVQTGAHYQARTRDGGAYTISGLTPGGPYTITVAAINYTPSSKTDLYLDIGTSVNDDFVIGSEVIKLAEITVSASRETTFDTTAMGTGSMFSTPEVSRIESVRRDLQDLENLDPRTSMMQVGPSDSQFTLSVAGQNPRENNFLVDGVSAADNFGLNSNGYAGARNPIPPDWVSSLSLEINPYDLTFSGFSGGILNATLKSGTNEFHGSIYELYTGTRFRGPDPVVGLLGTHEPMNEHTTGFTFSGPILKNKLFFFVGYDAFREIASAPAQLFNPADTASDLAVVNSIITQAKALGYDPGQLTNQAHFWEQNFVAKFDWNISDAHKFEFTFRHTAGNLPQFYNYTGSTTTSLSNSWYNSHRTDQSYTAKLISDWSAAIPNLHTEIEATYKRYNGTATLDGKDFPAVSIFNVQGASTPTPGNTTIQPNGTLFLGTYYAYQLNNIYTWEQEQHLYADYSVGNHTFKFGAQFDRTGYTDTFVPNYLGSYTFSNVSDWLNAAPTGVTIVAPYSYPTGSSSPTQTYTLGSDVSHYYLLDISPIIQDTWRPNSRLTVVAGARMDYPYEPQNPIFSQLFYNTWGYANNTTMNGNYTISPRFGFNYDLPTARKTQIRGGAGLFLGQNPVVWVENAFNNAGQLSTQAISNTSTPIGSRTGGAGYKFTGNPATQPLPPSALQGNAPVPSFDVIDPNFHWPSLWKENIAVDHELPFWHLVLTAEADFTQVQHDVFQKQLNYQLATSGPAFMPDGAIRYNGNITPTNIGSQYFVPGFTTSNYYTSTTSTSSATLLANTATSTVYDLTNTNKGGSEQYTLMIRRAMKDNWAFSLAYTHTFATQVDPLPSSVASSNFLDDPGLNPNDNHNYRSQYEIPNKFVATMTRDFHFFPWSSSKTSISAQAIVQTGQPFSYVFKGDANGDGISGEDLFYVPAGPNDPLVTWASATEEAAFFQYLASNPDLSRWAGKVASRNSSFAQWQRTVNLHVEQEVPISGNYHLTLFADCFNFANLLNKKWGVVTNYDGSFETQTIAGTGYSPTGNGGKGQYIYTFNAGTLGLPTTFSDMSRWNIQVGARLEF